MYRTNTSAVRNVVSELQMPLRNVLALYDTLVRLAGPQLGGPGGGAPSNKNFAPPPPNSKTTIGENIGKCCKAVD